MQERQDSWKYINHAEAHHRPAWIRDVLRARQIADFSRNNEKISDRHSQADAGINGR